MPSIQSEPRVNAAPGSVPIPTITAPGFLLGLMGMNVLSAMIIALFLCAIPTLLFAAAGIRDPSVFQSHALFGLILAIGVPFGLNVMFVGSWCFNGLFYSINRRIVVAILLSLWFATLVYYSPTAFEFALDLGIALVVLFRAIWVKAHGGREPY